MIQTLILVGCGNMGRALLNGWASWPQLNVFVVEPNVELRTCAKKINGKANIQVFADVTEIPNSVHADLIVLAVKPQIMGTILPAYNRWAGGDSLFLSIAAGLTLPWFKSNLPDATPIVRCMPNTPVAIGEGMLVCCANSHVNSKQLQNVCGLLDVCGTVRTVADEALMDAVTALSGSGPAYVFHMIECLVTAGKDAGLSPDLAKTLATQTVFGAGKLALQSSETPETLRVQVTSPGGTTAAALNVLRSNSALQTLISEALQAAMLRSRELEN